MLPAPTPAPAKLLHRRLAARPAPKRAAGGRLQAGGFGSRCARAKCRCVGFAGGFEPALTYAEHNVYTFAEATAPHLAAHDEGRTIEPARLSAGLAWWRARADVVLVEGAGGWRAPLSGQLDFADWVAAEKLPVLLVVGMRLGCINRAAHRAGGAAGGLAAGGLGGQLHQPCAAPA